MRFDPGTPVRCEMTKWPDRPHWEFAGHYLGSDHHGDWIGYRAGMHASRPGAEFVAPCDHVSLVPAPDLHERGWLATFWSAGAVHIYVDVTTPPVWEGTTVRSVDLDLDVVQGRTGRLWIDDEDEFADHRVRFAYPADLVAGALASCAWVEQAVRAGAAPYDGGTADGWIERLARLAQ